MASTEKPLASTILGLTGTVSDARVAAQAQTTVAALLPDAPQDDIDLTRMAQWAMNYLVRSPRKELNYEPVFQCEPMNFPPAPPGHDVVVPCDTDVRMNWEWYYMREVSGSKAGQDVEAGFHKMILDYVQEDGSVLSHPGCYNEGDIDRIYKKEEYFYHVWGATKILLGLAEDFRRTGNEPSKVIARKLMLRLKRLAVFPSPDTCYFPAGMGAVRQDGSPIPNAWNRNPAPVVESLLNYYLATGDREAFEFARAYANGIMTGAQPDGIRFAADGNIGEGQGHAVMHALWGVAHLGVLTGEEKYTAFAKRSWDWMLSQGTGAGWFPAAPWWAETDETCLVSDMMSNAALIARAGHPEYFDFVERYLRNRISPAQFIMTPEFETQYRNVHAALGEEGIQRGLEESGKYQGGIRGVSGLNDLENTLLGGHIRFMLGGCCVSEGMRAIYTAWVNVIDHLPESRLGPAGVYVNMYLSRDSKWGRIVSFFPQAGRLTVKAAVNDTFFLRPPHWAPREQVRAFLGAKVIPVVWSGSYVRFDRVRIGRELTITYPLIRFTHEAGGQWKRIAPNLKLTYEWLGNMVVSVDPPPTGTPVFTGKPTGLPPPPGE